MPVEILYVGDAYSMCYMDGWHIADFMYYEDAVQYARNHDFQIIR